MVFPTETVYGIAADPSSPAAVRRLRALKGRSQTKAMTLQVATVAQALKLVRPDPRFARCARKFWPGPLTIVAAAPRGARKVGVRIPAHPTALGILRAFGKPLIVTSANRSGQPELWRRNELKKFFDGKAGAVFWEPSRPRLASTVIDVSGKDAVRVLREGRISEKEIQRAVSAAA